MASTSKSFDGELALKADLEASGLDLLVPPSSLKKLSNLLQVNIHTSYMELVYTNVYIYQFGLVHKYIYIYS